MNPARLFAGFLISCRERLPQYPSECPRLGATERQALCEHGTEVIAHSHIRVAIGEGSTGHAGGVFREGIGLVGR